jgi:hypothetical protein
VDPLEGALARWAEIDEAGALHPLDRDVVRGTAAARSLVLDLFAAISPRDLFNACARLGDLMAGAGASPSLAAGAIDGAARSLAEAGIAVDPGRVGPARAACLEAFAARIRESERAAVLASWRFPAPVVPLGAGEVAVACGHPDGDAEALAAWAGEIAARLAKRGVRTAVLDGGERARAEVASALELVGIAVRPPAEPRPKSWLPWRR